MDNFKLFDWLTSKSLTDFFSIEIDTICYYLVITVYMQYMISKVN